MQATAEISSGPNDGLYEVVLAAATAAGKAADGAVGILGIAPRSPDTGLSVSIEAKFAYQGERRVIDSLEMRFRTEKTPKDAREAVLRDAIARFGGTALTNLSASRGGQSPGSDAGLDLTVSFESRLAFLATNLLLPIENAGASDLAAYRGICSELGVASQMRDGTLVVRRKSFRAPMTVERQVAAYRAARTAGFDTALYAAMIPCKQAVRFAESGSESEARPVDVVLSRGLTPRYTCTSDDAIQMQRFLATHAAFSFENRDFGVTNTFGERRADAEPARHGLKWFAEKRPRR